MINKDKSLKYHCPYHPDRPPFCAIGDYTPCRECYYRFRNIKLPPDLLAILIIILVSSAAWCGQVQFWGTPEGFIVIEEHVRVGNYILVEGDPNRLQDIGWSVPQATVYHYNSHQALFYLIAKWTKPTTMQSFNVLSQHWLQDSPPKEKPDTPAEPNKIEDPNQPAEPNLAELLVGVTDPNLIEAIEAFYE